MVLLSGRLDDAKANDGIARLLAAALDASASGPAVRLHLLNVDGSEAAALAIRDVIAVLDAPVFVRAGGQLGTAGLLVLSACEPGHRLLTATTTAMLTPVDAPPRERADVEAAARERAQLRVHVAAILGLEVTKATSLSAADIIARGWADEIVT